MRLIDVNLFAKKVLNTAAYPVAYVHGRGLTISGGLTISDIAKLLDKMPTVDAVPVIRCNDCMYNYGNKYECDYNHEDIVCTYWMSDGLTDKDFCSKGERKK